MGPRWYCAQLRSGRLHEAETQHCILMCECLTLYLELVCIRAGTSCVQIVRPTGTCFMFLRAQDPIMQHRTRSRSTIVAFECCGRCRTSVGCCACSVPSYPPEARTLAVARFPVIQYKLTSNILYNFAPRCAIDSDQVLNFTHSMRTVIKQHLL